MGGLQQPRAERGIWKLPIEGGNAVCLSDAEAADPTVSPDGKMIAYLYKDPSANPPNGLEILHSESQLWRSQVVRQ